jgi:HSP20 family protein
MVWMNPPNSPWPTFGRLQREMNRLQGRSAGNPGAQQRCALNLSSDADEALLVARIPGVTPEAVDLSIEGRLLRLAITRSQGTTRRDVRLPWAADGDAVKASLKHGRLEVRIPRLAADRPRPISIDTAPNA